MGTRTYAVKKVQILVRGKNHGLLPRTAHNPDEMMTYIVHKARPVVSAEVERADDAFPTRQTDTTDKTRARKLLRATLNYPACLPWTEISRSERRAADVNAPECAGLHGSSRPTGGSSNPIGFYPESGQRVPAALCNW